MPSGAAPLSSEMVQLLQDFVSRYGEEALARALQAGHLFASDQRPLTQLAFKHSGDYAEAGLPHALVIKVDPRAKFEPMRVQAQLITGKVSIELGFGESVSA